MPRKVNDELIVKMKEDYASGKSSRTIAKDVGISKSTVMVYVNPKVLTPEEIEEKRRKNVETVTNWRRNLKKRGIDYKGGSCEVCGYDKCNEALEFHHKDPNEKDFGIGANGHTRSWEKVKIELDKCMIVCSNCHREIHAGLIEC